MMVDTKKFRMEHDDLRDLASRIISMLNPDLLAKDANDIKILLNKLTFQLTMHITMEDNVLYPELLKSSDDNVVTIARAFVQEMGQIGKVYEDYSNHWISTEKIQANVDEFISETKKIINALDTRIEKENTQLFELADKQ